MKMRSESGVKPAPCGCVPVQRETWIRRAREERLHGDEGRVQVMHLVRTQEVSVYRELGACGLGGERFILMRL